MQGVQGAVLSHGGEISLQGAEGAVYVSMGDRRYCKSAKAAVYVSISEEGGASLVGWGSRRYIAEQVLRHT
jgi:hypothetical protein